MRRKQRLRAEVVVNLLRNRPRQRDAVIRRGAAPDLVEHDQTARGGVAQDCDRGLKMLRTSAYQSNEKAMISLGALYSTGLCAPRDLPTAYRWFAVALRKEPDNPALQQNLQKLWSQMTRPERQLAIKLSQ